jgi:hypothetical protein
MNVASSDGNAEKTSQPQQKSQKKKGWDARQEGISHNLEFDGLPAQCDNACSLQDTENHQAIGDIRHQKW